MDEIDLDRELRRVLAATPSPEFVARVRTKIAEVPRPPAFAGMWRPVAAIACAAIVAAVVALHEDVPLAPSAEHELSSTAYRTLATPHVDLRRSVAVPVSVKASKSATRATITGEPELPEVMVNQKDVAALWDFVTSANAGQFVASFDETPAPIPWVTTELSSTPLESAPARNN
jgi:hypothetical protein